MPGIRGASGASLIEALVTIVLLSTSLLGLAMMQAQGFKFAASSYKRTQANFLAYDIIDKMRLDPASAADYTVEDPGGNCSPATVSVENDLNCWYRGLETSLTALSGEITQNGSLYTVTVNWTDQSVRTTGANQRLVSFTFEP